MRPLPLCFLVLALPFPLRGAEAAREEPILALNTGGHTGRIHETLFTPDGKRLISLADDRAVRVWDVQTGEEKQVLRLPAHLEDAKSLEQRAQGAALSADGRLLAVAVASPRQGESWVYLLDLEGKQVARVFKGYARLLWAVALSRDGKWLAAGGAGGTVLVWDVASGETKHRLDGTAPLVRAVAFAPDGKTLAAGEGSGAVRLWSVQDGKSEKMLQGHEGRVLGLAWSPDGKTLASHGLDRTLRLWRPDGTARATLRRRGRGTGLSFSADSRFLLAGSTVYNVALERVRTAFRSDEADERGSAAALSPDGRIAAWGGDGELFLWDASGRRRVDEPLRRLGGQGQTMRAAAWGPDGKTLAWEYEGKAGGRSFDLTTLTLGPPPDGALGRAVHALGGLTLEKVGTLQLAVKKGKDTVSTLRLRGLDGVRCYTFLGEDRVVLGAGSGLYLYEAKTGRRLRQFEGVEQLRTVAPAPDRRTFVSGGLDQALSVWLPDRAAPLLSLFVAGPDWIVWTPEGYYGASAGGERLMGWQVNHGPEQLATFYPAARFRAALFRPDVIRKLLAAGSVEKALAEADRESGKQTQRVEVEQVLPPRVTILSPDRPALEVTKAQLKVKARATPTGRHPIAALSLRLNGRPYEGSRGAGRLPEPLAAPKEMEWEVELEPGTHRLSVRATSAVSTGESDVVVVTFNPDAVPQPSLYVLAVGINAYEGDWRLDCAVNDAQELARSFAKNSKALFQKVETHQVVDRQATREGILGGLAWLKQRVKPHDVAVVFFAGHGEADAQGHFCLLPVDVDFKRIGQTGVAGDLLKKELIDLPGVSLLVLDACHSKAVGGARRRGAEGLVSELASECGVIVLVAAQGPEESKENRAKGHGYFTLALLEALGGEADQNKNGVVHLHELISYVQNRVPELTRDRQHPDNDKPIASGSFPLAKP